MICIQKMVKLATQRTNTAAYVHLRLSGTLLRMNMMYVRELAQIAHTAAILIVVRIAWGGVAGGVIRIIVTKIIIIRVVVGVIITEPGVIIKVAEPEIIIKAKIVVRPIVRRGGIIAIIITEVIIIPIIEPIVEKRPIRVVATIVSTIVAAIAVLIVVVTIGTTGIIIQILVQIFFLFDHINRSQVRSML